MTKEEYLEIRNVHGKDCLPALHYYHNLCVKKEFQLTLDEFSYAYGSWMKIPIVMISQGAILELTFKKLDIHYGL